MLSDNTTRVLVDLLISELRVAQSIDPDSDRSRALVTAQDEIAKLREWEPLEGSHTESIVDDNVTTEMSTITVNTHSITIEEYAYGNSREAVGSFQGNIKILKRKDNREWRLLSSSRRFANAGG